MAESQYLSTDPAWGAPLPPSAARRFAEGVTHTLNPMGLVQAALHPVDTVGALIDAHAQQLEKAKQAYTDGRYSEAIGHLGAAALPVLGPAAANAGERIGSGDIAGGLGEATGLLASVEVPRGVATAGKSLSGVRATLAAPADVALDALVRKTGIDPDALNLAATRMRLQAARSRTRQAQTLSDLNQPATSPAGTVPVGSAPAPPAPTPVRTAAPQVAPATPATPATDPILKVAADLKQMGFSDAEANQAIRWKQQGVPTEEVIARLQATKALQQGSSPFANLPTDLDVARKVESAKRTKKF